MKVKVTMTEIEAGQGYNDGPELRLLIQADEITTLPQALATLTDTQATTFAGYQRQPSDYRPIMGPVEGFRFADEWTFPR